MPNTHRLVAIAATLVSATVLLQGCNQQSAASSPPEHVRGSIESRDHQFVTVATSMGPVTVQLASSTTVALVAASDRSQINENSFLGVASLTQADGSQRAVEVTIFPESMRGTSEGHYDWDVPAALAGNMMGGMASKMTNGRVGGSKMTNGTVSTRQSGSSLTLQYGDTGSGGSQTIDIPPDIPIVTLAPGQLADLEAGAHVFIVAHRDSEGQLIADRVLAGRDGVVPPM